MQMWRLLRLLLRLLSLLVAANAVRSSEADDNAAESTASRLLRGHEAIPSMGPAVRNATSGQRYLQEPEIDCIGNNGIPEDLFPLQRCQGDCDSDRECDDSLVCFERSGNEEIPGCTIGDDPETFLDFCVDPGDIQPTPNPTRDPTSKPTRPPINTRPTPDPTRDPSPRPSRPPTPAPVASNVVRWVCNPCDDNSLYVAVM